MKNINNKNNGNISDNLNIDNINKKRKNILKTVHNKDKNKNLHIVRILKFLKLHKKFFVLLFTTITLLIMLLTALIYIYLYKSSVSSSVNEFNTWIQNFLDNNEEEIFLIDKITVFSSCDANYKTNSINHFTIENLYQYLDIAIFINPLDSNLTAKNTYKTVFITNFKLNTTTTLGITHLSFKSVNDFASPIYIEEYILNDESNILNFEISSLNDLDLSSPILYNNYANPITLTYINSNIVTDYTFTDTSSSITYNGTLLNKCNIDISKIYSSFSFDIYIENNLGEKYKTTISIDNTSTSNISELLSTGYFSYTNSDVSSKFYRYE